MIEGLKVTVHGDELFSLCMEQADFHRQRAAFYADKVRALEGVPSNASNGYSGQDPMQQMQAKLNEHKNAMCELQFIGAHVVRTEHYLLSSVDLQKIGIVRKNFGF